MRPHGAVANSETGTENQVSQEKNLHQEKVRAHVLLLKFLKYLGCLVVPAVFEPKLIMQQMAKRNIKWDEDVTDN